MELLALPFFPPGFAGKWSPFGRSIFAAPAPMGAPPQACGFSAPRHSCSGALRPRPAGSPLRGTRARGRSAPGRSSRPLAPPPPARESPSAPTLRPLAPPPMGAFPRHPRRPFASLRAAAPFFEAAIGGLSDFRSYFMLFLRAFLIFAVSKIINLTYAYENRENSAHFWFGHHNFRRLEKFFKCFKKILFRGFKRPRRKLLIVRIYILRLWEH